MDEVNLEAGAKNSLPLTVNNHEKQCEEYQPTSFDDQRFTEAPKTAHQIGKDSWVQVCFLLIHPMNGANVLGYSQAIMVHLGWIAGVVGLVTSTALSLWVQVCFVLTTSINGAYVLGYSQAIMVHLGWIAGVVGIIAATALSLYANTLVAKIHEVGGQRHIRYRDLAGYFYGKKGYYTLWILQYLLLFMFNIGYIILGGSAIKDVYGLFSSNNALKLPYCNLIAGFVCFLFAIMVPHLSALRVWLCASAILAMIYIVIAIAISIHDGINSPAKDFSIPGTSIEKIFLTIGAVSNLFFPFNGGMVPEIQATIRAPVVGNMIKALFVQLTIGVIPIFVVMFARYWAYGSSTSSYLLNNASGSVWAKALANIAAFLQAIVSFHTCACPLYEYVDTTFSAKESGVRIQNLSQRVGLRGVYLAVCSVIAALLPFIGDFIGLMGSICIRPLTFGIPHHLYMMTKNRRLSSLQKLWHWLNVIIFGVLSATIESMRLIVIDSKHYKIFGDE